MGHGLLITGTDTGVGKTFVGCGIAAALRRRGLRVAPFKPAETGCEWDETSQSLIPADAVLLRAASQTDAPMDVICPYRYHQPLAPAVAAELENLTVPFDEMKARLEECYATLSHSHDVVLVETAGGILVPLAYGFHYGDLALLLNIPVLVVIGSTLGAINHTLLTLSYLDSAGLKVAGCVINHLIPEKSPAVETNEAALRKLVFVPVHSLSNCAADDQDKPRIYADELTNLLFNGIETEC